MDEWLIEFMPSWLGGWLVSGKIDGDWSWMGGWLDGSEDGNGWVD